MKYGLERGQNSEQSAERSEYGKNKGEWQADTLIESGKKRFPTRYHSPLFLTGLPSSTLYLVAVSTMEM